MSIQQCRALNVYLHMKYLNLFILSCFLFSCSSQDVQSELKIQSIKADVDNAETLFFSNYFEEVSYVPLETSDTFLLGLVTRMIINDNDLYLQSGKSIFKFSLETGKGILNLSKLGNGPKEYKSLFDFSIDKKNENIEILDNNGKKIFTYSSEGDFLTSKEIPFMPFSFMKLNDDTYLFYNSNLSSDFSSSKIVTYNPVSQIKGDEYFTIDKNMANYFFLGDEKVFNTTSKNVYCHISPLDTIYVYKGKKGFVPTYYLDFVNHAAPTTFYDRKYRDIMEFSEAAQKNQYIYSLSNYSVNDKEDVLFSYRLGKTFYWTFKLGVGTVITINSFKDDFNSSPSIPLTYHNSSYYLSNDFLYFLISAEQFLEICNVDSTSNEIKELIKSQNISEQSNPIIVKCKIKKK